MDIYIMTDQPECCRKCGARTNFIELDSDKQEHTCPNCGYKYILEEDSDEEDTETICCDNCGHEYDRHIGDLCPNCGHDNHEQYEEKFGFNENED